MHGKTLSRRVPGLFLSFLSEATTKPPSDVCPVQLGGVDLLFPVCLPTWLISRFGVNKTFVVGDPICGSSSTNTLSW